MDKKLYDLMDWAEIEAIVYSEHDHPERVLGPHKVRGGMLVQTFLPGAKSVFAKSLRDGKIYALEEADEAGFFAVIMPGRRESAYELIARYEDGVEKKEKDPYLYGCCIPQEEWEPLANGTHHALYRYLGAHPVRVSGWGENTQASWDITEREKEKKGSVSGVHFAVWAPHALRVSVVGNFNQWDGRRHPMMRMGDTGIFTLFIPDIGCGEIYKYEIKWNARTMVLKSDPFAFRSELRPANASIVTNMARYEWGDEDWLARRRQETYAEKPFLIYEMSLSGWKVCHTVSKKEKQEGAAGFSNYREIAPELARYIKKMGYTHIELFPVMEHPLDESLGYLTTGFYAATARHGSPQDFMYFVDYMHRQGIGVIVDWMATQFPKQENGLAKFDGSALYECESGSEHPYSDALLFNYSNARVCDFLISNAVFWRDVYHLDGLRVPELNAALYLDYGRTPGESGFRTNTAAMKTWMRFAFFKSLAGCFTKKRMERCCWQSRLLRGLG
ncbi:MAG: hypothetical protein LUH14_03780 [Clostridiaceae bacterium]|nr:hypothetical protein [Clostridiaceae bacterium]